MTMELSDSVGRRVDDLVSDVVRQLAGWGHECTRRPRAVGGDKDSQQPAGINSMDV